MTILDKRFLFSIWLFCTLVLPGSAQEAISISREGFPYCEPFTGTLEQTRGETVLGGEVGKVGAYLTNQPNGQGALRLTEAAGTVDVGNVGYAYIDIPFSSKYGVKVSFEYFSYGSTSSVGADGISFFMFDGRYGNVPGPWAFKPGGLGGSLSYAPYQRSCVDPGPGATPSQIESYQRCLANNNPGLTGGYIGVSLDEYGNFATNTEGRVTGIEDYNPNLDAPPMPTPAEQNAGQWLRPHSILVRGPHNASPTPYPYLRPLHRYTNYSATTCSMCVEPGEEFTLDVNSSQRVERCDQIGYRKVFLNLEPNGAGYLLSMYMLVNTDGNERIVQIFDQEPYNYPGFETLKLGFAASIGGANNNHEIRNVVAEVSEISDELKPRTEDKNFQICVDEAEFVVQFPIVNLNDRGSNFIRCLQLFEDISEVPSPGSANPWPPTTASGCGFGDAPCYGICDPENYEVSLPGKGTFTSNLGDLTDINRDEVKIDFVGEEGFVGEAVIWYTVTDRFGLVSDPKKITVNILPRPILRTSEEVYPTCGGQYDGSIVLEVENLYDGFEYRWNALADGNLGQAGTVEDLGGNVRRFTLSNVNTDTYSLYVANPSDGDGNCELEIYTEIIELELGTPLIVEALNETVCEGEQAQFTAQVEDQYNSGNVGANFLWYIAGDRSGGALTTGSTVNIDGSEATVTLGSNGILMIDGLMADGSNPKDYIFYVEAENQNNPGGNFCPFINEPQSVSITVFPSIDVALQTEGDWCLDNQGTVFTGDLGVPEQKTFTIKNQDGVIVDERTAVEYSYGQLSVGDYILEVRHPEVCFSPSDFSIEGPVDKISINELGRVPASCGLPNGSWTFDIEGGNGPYDINSISVTGGAIGVINYDDSSGEFILMGLASLTAYVITVTDSKGCSLVYNLPATPDTDPVFDVEGDEICTSLPNGGGPQTAHIRPIVIELAGSTPLYQWYYLNDNGDEIAVQDGVDILGATVSISSEGEVSLAGLPASSDPYVFLLDISDEEGKVCSGPLLRAEVIVNPLPAPIFELDEVSCFEGRDGAIKLESGGSSFFTYILVNTGESNSTGEFIGLSAGNYTVRVENSQSGCWDEFSFDILQPETPLSIQSFEVLKASCDLPNGIIQNLSVSGGTPPYTIEWFKGASLADPLSQGTSTELEDVFAGIYTLRVTDSIGCEDLMEIEVGSMAEPVYQMTTTAQEICEGESVSFAPIHLGSDPDNPPAPTEVYWYKNSGLVGLIETGQDSENPEIRYEIDDSLYINPELTITGLPVGTYTYYFYVVCTGQEIPVEITVAPIPVPEFAVTVETCAGSTDGRIQVVSSESDEWLFSINGGSFLSKSDLETQNFGPGLYEILTKSSFGCLADIVVVEILGTDPLDLKVIQTKDAACGVDDGFIKVSINGGWPDYTLTLTERMTGTVETVTSSDPEYTFENLTSGEYDLEIRDSEGCTFTLDSPVNILDGPTEILIENLVEICEGEIVRLKPDINPPASQKIFRWYKNTVSADSEITDGLIEGDVSYQLKSNGSLTITGLTSNESPSTFLVLVEGSDVCEGDVEAVEVNIYQEPQFTASVENETCFGEGGAILLNSIVSASNITFSLNGGDFTAYPDNRISGLTPGSYTLSAQHASGCLYDLPEPLVIEGPNSALRFTSISIIDASCSEDNGLIVGGVEGGWAPYTVKVFGINGIVDEIVVAESGEQFGITGLGVGIYSLTAIDDEGCEVVKEQQTVEDSPTSILVEDVEICIGESASLQPRISNTSLSPTFSWYYDADGQEPINPGQINDVTFQIGGDGEMVISGLSSEGSPYTYYVSVEGQGICPGALEEVNVSVNSIPFLRTSNPSIICDPTETVDLTQFIDGFNTDIYDYYVINPSGINLRLEEVRSISVSGTYNVQMGFKGSSCLTPSERILVVISETELVASFDYQVDIGNGDLIVNQGINIGEDVEFFDTSAGDAIFWSWDFGDGGFSSDQNPVHAFEKEGRYVIKLTTLDKNGCESEFQRVVDVVDEFLVIVPNAFTPARSDGKNNLFSPKFRGLRQIELLIFNTWGNLIFRSDSMENIGWDGRFEGKDVPNGNYVYKVDYTSRGGQKGTQSGVFVLIR